MLNILTTIEKLPLSDILDKLAEIHRIQTSGFFRRTTTSVAEQTEPSSNNKITSIFTRKIQDLISSHYCFPPFPVPPPYVYLPETN